MGFRSVISFAHQLIEERATAGDVVVDATAGNGVDTLFLARLVGRSGTVHAFDVQEEALRRTGERLTAEEDTLARAPIVPDGNGTRAGIEAGARPRTSSFALAKVTLHHASHSLLAERLPPAVHGRLAAVMFNLGYLPGADPSVITLPESTLTALDSALRLLRKGGILTVVVYPGHEGGQQEAQAVEEWASRLRPERAQVMVYRFLNRQNHPPYLIALEKRSDESDIT